MPSETYYVLQEILCPIKDIVKCTGHLDNSILIKALSEDKIYVIELGIIDSSKLFMFFIGWHDQYSDDPLSLTLAGKSPPDSVIIDLNCPKSLETVYEIIRNPKSNWPILE